MLLASVLLAGCGRGDEAAHALIAQAVAAHGGESYRDQTFGFTFRDRAYTARLEARDGSFRYTRTSAGPGGARFTDVLDNSGLTRRRTDGDGNGENGGRGEAVALGARDSAAFVGSVNSVLYFALLPYPLLDAAVRPALLGTDTVRGQAYDVVGVTFAAEGGGADHEDEYVYWIHRTRRTLDYLAYNYRVDGGGARFREAYHPRTVGGVRWQDYRNYAPLDSTRRDVRAFARAWGADELELLSVIELEGVTARAGVRAE